MKKLLLAGACALALAGCGQAPVVTPAKAAETKADDYLNAKLFSCNKKWITENITELYEEGPEGKRGEKVIYVRGEPVEMSREPSKLRCAVTIVTNLRALEGVFEFLLEDGESLVAWEPVRRVR